MKNEIFSEYFAVKNNFLSRIDCRLKIVFIIPIIIAIIASSTLYLPLICGLLAIIILLSIRMPLKVLLVRLSAPLGIGCTIFFIKVFFLKESSSNSLPLLFKIVSTTALILLLSLTTTLDKMLSACLWFKFPKIWVEICFITYRYIFVLLDDAITVFDAQKVRLGYSNPINSLRSLGTLAGMIIIRAYDQSIATYEAMSLRGYK